MDCCKRYDLKSDNSNHVLRNGQSVVYKINSDIINVNEKHSLFFTCEDALCPATKNESGAELLYMSIDDSLNYDKAQNNRYCLDLSCTKPLPYAKRCIKKVIWQPLIYGLYKYDNFTVYNSSWCYGISAMAENLKIADNGYLRLRFERWALKDGINPHDTTSEPDETQILDIPSGSYPYTVFSNELIIERDNTACVIVTLEGENYSGNVYFENPFLKDNSDRNMLPEFEKGSLGLERFAWLGQNLSKREWPHLKIAVNDRVIFDDEVFLKVHRFSPVEIQLPDDCFINGDNNVSITYLSDYLDVIPLVFEEVELLEKPNSPFSIIRCPDEIIFGEDVRLLVETQTPHDDPFFESGDFELNEVSRFTEFNLQVLSLTPLRQKNNLEFTFGYGSNTQTYYVKRCVNKTDDNVIAGSGDMIYIDISDTRSVIDYLKWYVANDIGKLVTIRPVYRWGGQRTVNSGVWAPFKELCEKLDLNYVHISDGRDIPGLATNPSPEMLCGKNFLGRQLHERDGQLFYWSPGVGHPREIASPYEEFFDLAARMGREYPDTIEGSYRPFNIEWSDFGYSYRRNFSKTADISEIHDIVCGELNDLSRDNFKRHTGPAVMYKYFYQNGFEWTGAETMDGATEILLAFLRGASTAYDVRKYGVHLALQWSTFPHDTAQRYKRYLLSLYIPYMHGVTDINTEEGLWFMEARYAYHNRISEPCQKHRDELSRFNKFVRTHSRTGKFYTPIAFLHGRMDGWNGFLVHNIWGMPFIKPGDESLSWNLLKLFYPLNALDEHGCHKTGCIPADTDKPFGIFSGTPNGNVDAVPVEHGDLSSYSALVFAGYNKAEKADLDRLENYIACGGTLVCTWAHFSDTTLKSDLENYNLNITQHALTSYLSDGKPVFVSDFVGGKEIKVCSNYVSDCDILQKTDSGIPLVYTVKHGEGQIILVNTLYYPGNEAVMPVYEKTVNSLTKDILNNEPVRIQCAEDVQYTIFKQDEGTRHYYFTAVDWYNSLSGNRSAGITFDENSYNIDVPFAQIVKLVTDGKTAVWPLDDSAEVISLSGDSFVAQGFGSQKFLIARCGELKTCTLDFTDDPVLTFRL